MGGGGSGLTMGGIAADEGEAPAPWHPASPEKRFLVPQDLMGEVIAGSAPGVGGESNRKGGAGGGGVPKIPILAPNRNPPPPPSAHRRT